MRGSHSSPVAAVRDGGGHFDSRRDGLSRQAHIFRRPRTGRLAVVALTLFYISNSL